MSTHTTGVSATEAYRAACAKYTQAVVSAHRTRHEAEERYRSEVAGVRQTAQRAVAAREAANKQAEAAKKLVTETDDTAADIWRRLSSYVGGKRLGMTPPPDTGAGLKSAEEVRNQLARTKRTIALAQRGELPFAPPRRAVPFSIGIGAAGGLLAAWGAGLLLGTSGHNEGTRAAVQAAALVVLFIGAFAGIPVVSGWLAIRHRIGVRPIHIGACIAGAVVAMCALGSLTLTG